MSDIVERLRKARPDEHCNDSACEEAADEIERLRSALKTISLMDKVHEHDLFSATCVARAALAQEKPND